MHVAFRLSCTARLLPGAMAIVGLGALGCAPSESQITQLSSWMQGSFSSAEQHAGNSKNYHDINLHMAAIWKQRADGPWIYVEQAAAAKPEKPYRQRVYQLRESGGVIESIIYSLPGDPLRFVGAWKRPSMLNAVIPEDLIPREGCSMMLYRSKNGDYMGSTSGNVCQSTLDGASYATSRVSIGPRLIMSLDQGFDASGKQVWGPSQGPYIFKKHLQPGDRSDASGPTAN